MGGFAHPALTGTTFRLAVQLVPKARTDSAKAPCQTVKLKGNHMDTCAQWFVCQCDSDTAARGRYSTVWGRYERVTSAGTIITGSRATKIEQSKLEPSGVAVP
jgi:hypothetical protein